jgi:3-hydroxyisobutyrate dehydrogenase-like beta-hydroxyacid dehydrogenase
MIRTMRIGLLHPGEMGAAFGNVLRTRGHDVLWVSGVRSDATAERARSAGLEAVATVAELAAQTQLVLSICPPHAAIDVADELSAFDGIYVDANAIAPATALEVQSRFGRFVDGSIIGAPPLTRKTATLYLSGTEASTVAELFRDTNVRATVISDQVGAASALKMVYAAWTKGSAALLLASAQAATAAGVDAELLAEWQRSQPDVPEQLAHAQRAAMAKGWRWVGEMQEIAEFFASVGEPDGFHRAAAEVYGQFPR